MATLGLIAGSVGSVFVLFLGYILVTTMTGYHDFEGATAMGLAFGVMPVVAVAGGVGGAVVFAHMARRA